MAKTKTHDFISLILLPVIMIFTYQIINNYIITGIIVISYLFSSFMFNGDLDMHSKPYNRWYFLKMIWIPYQLIFKHRSIFTHGILIGTIIRLIYLGTLPSIYLLIENKFIYVICSLDPNIALPIFIGLELGSMVHTILDKIS